MSKGKTSFTERSVAMVRILDLVLGASQFRVKWLDMGGLVEVNGVNYAVELHFHPEKVPTPFMPGRKVHRLVGGKVEGEGKLWHVTLRKKWWLWGPEVLKASKPLSRRYQGKW